MKRKTLLLFATLVALGVVTYAVSPFCSLESVHDINTILKDF
ncbi:YicS family protein, partial [Salmonella enterica subsp. enterica serovar Infantis]